MIYTIQRKNNSVKWTHTNLNFYTWVWQGLGHTTEVTQCRELSWGYLRNSRRRQVSLAFPQSKSQDHQARHALQYPYLQKTEGQARRAKKLSACIRPFWLFLVVAGDSISGSSSWSFKLSITKMTLNSWFPHTHTLFPPPQCLDYRHASTHLDYVAAGIEPVYTLSDLVQNTQVQVFLWFLISSWRPPCHIKLTLNTYARLSANLSFVTHALTDNLKVFSSLTNAS